jgi:hypothetical protein
MDIVKIQTLIAQGRVVELTDIDPTQSFVQIGIYQPDNRKIGSANNTYPPFVIPLSELGGGGNSTNKTVINATIDLNTTLDQFIVIPTGTYIIDKVYLSNASVDVSTTSAFELSLFDATGLLVQSTDAGPCPPPGICPDNLPYLFIPQNYITLAGSGFPSCWPPPCNSAITYTEGDILRVTLTTASGVPATVKMSIIVHQID